MSTVTSSGSSDPEPNSIILGDVREALTSFPNDFFDLIVTSPPYWGLREYGGDDKEIGAEPDSDTYIANLARVFGSLRLKLRTSGSLWVNIGDVYRNGPLELPARFAYIMRQVHGWKLINSVIWYKTDAMGESVTRRFSQKYEMFYWFVKDLEFYYFNAEAAKIPVSKSSVERLGHKFSVNKGTAVSRMRGMIGDQSEKIDTYLEKGVNAGDIWALPTNKDKVEHAAPYPIYLIVRPIVACCPPGGKVFDPFMGSGTTALAVIRMGEDREFYGTELYAKARDEALKRLEPELKQGTLI